MIVGRAIVVLGVGLGCLVLSGCAVPLPSAGDAAEIATRFTSAVAAGDGATACDLLSPGAVMTLTETPGARCPDTILSLQLPDGGTALHEEAYGRAAFVQLQNDTVFLTVSGGRWAVRAAGCTPAGDAPYSCTLKGD